MPDKNNVKDGRLVRPKFVPNTVLIAKADVNGEEPTQAGGEPNIGHLWQSLGAHKQRDWFRFLFLTNPVVNYLVHHMLDAGPRGPRRVPELPANVAIDAEEERLARDGARFRVRCQCGKRISLFMTGIAQLDWERRRVECPVCHITYEFERKGA